MPTLNDHFLDSARHGNVKKFTHILLKQGVNVNVVDSYKQTAAFLASWKGHSDVVRLLVEKKADMNLENDTGTSPLMVASGHGREKIVALLLEVPGIKINFQDHHGLTSLFIACWMGHYEVVRLLVNKEADVNLEMDTGTSPLMIASEGDYVKIMKLLLDAGAELEQKTHNGNRALHLAIFRSKMEAAELLIDQGASLVAQNNNEQTPLDLAQSDEIKARLVMYSKLYETRKELTTLKNFVFASTFGKDSSGNDQAATLQGKVDKAIRDIATIRQDHNQDRQHATLQGTLDKVIKENAQLRNAVDELKNTVDELRQPQQQECHEETPVSNQRLVEWRRRLVKKWRGLPFFSATTA